MEITGRELLNAVDLANAVRAVAGENPIEDLVPGIAQDPNSCVLAATFNCSCKVQGENSETEVEPYTTEEVAYADINPSLEGDPRNYMGSPWFVYFNNKQYAEALGKELNRKVQDTDEGYAIQLPYHIGEIAAAFDSHDLDSKYYLG